MNNDLQYSTAVEPQRNSIGRLQYLSWGEFTGVVDITVASGQAWEIIFYQGQIVWSLDLRQPNRLWQRLLQAHVGDRISLDALLRAGNSPSWAGFAQNRKTCWYYQGAIALLGTNDVTVAQLMAMLAAAAVETIFDLLQYSQGQVLNFRSHSELFIDRPPIVVNTDEIVDRAEKLWAEWQRQKLGNISPNKIPVIKHPVQLYRQTTPIIYQNLVRVITGQQTLREIAMEIDEDLLLLTRSLTRYIQTGMIELIDLPDIAIPKLVDRLLPSSTKKLPTKTITVSPQAQSKLVICIDDSPQVCELMRAIVTDAGYRFMAIEDPTQALPRLLENPPDLIFLDLIMPKINGYEICGQIKRVSSLTKIPIIILTGRDGLIDRLRSKVVGASEFIAKPITKDAIDNALHKHIGISSSE